MAIITVSTVRPSNVPAGFVPVIASTRGAKGVVIPEAQKCRAIVVADYDASGLPSKFTEFVRAQLAVTAVAQLQELWKSQGDALKSVDSSLFTTDGLLAFAARQQESKRLTADSITSAVAEFVATCDLFKHDAARKAGAEVLASMAAPAKKGNERQLFALAEKLAAYLATPREDGEEHNPLLSSIIAKLTDKAEELKAQRLAFEQAGEDAFG